MKCLKHSPDTEEEELGCRVRRRGQRPRAAPTRMRSRSGANKDCEYPRKGVLHFTLTLVGSSRQ